jgi:hypothetical protein
MENEMEISFFKKKGIPHYYGDSVRTMFICCAVVYTFAMPLFGNLIPSTTGISIGIVLVLVLLAGITSPMMKWLMFINAAIAAIGIYLLQSAAIFFFDTESKVLFTLRELGVLFLLFAFYYSVKSFRSMMTHKIGREGRPGEFDSK